MYATLKLNLAIVKEDVGILLRKSTAAIATELIHHGSVVVNIPLRIKMVPGGLVTTARIEIPSEEMFRTEKTTEESGGDTRMDHM